MEQAQAYKIKLTRFEQGLEEFIDNGLDLVSIHFKVILQIWIKGNSKFEVFDKKFCLKTLNLIYRTF